MTFTKCVGGILLAAVSLVTHATPIQKIVYVSGIQTQIRDMDAARRRIQKILLQSVNHPGQQKIPFIVETIRNPIGFYGTTKGPDLTQDIAELFLLKTSEEIYRQSLLTLATPHDTWRRADMNAVAVVAAHAEDLTPSGTTLVDEGAVDDTYMKGVHTAISQLAQKMRDNPSLIIVAHSEGNIIANLAYARHAHETRSRDLHRTVRIVNIANTASVSINNLDLTHAGDCVLFGCLGLPSLADMPQRRPWVRTTPLCANNRCSFTVAEPTMHASSAVSGVLASHSLVGTYLSEKQVDVRDDRGVVYTPGATRFRDRFEDLVYNAATALAVLSGTARDDPRTIAYDDFPIATLRTDLWKFDYPSIYRDVTIEDGVFSFREGSVFIVQTRIPLSPGTRISFFASFPASNLCCVLPRSVIYVKSENLMSANYGIGYIRKRSPFDIRNDTKLVRYSETYSPQEHHRPMLVDVRTGKYYAFTIDYMSDGTLRYMVNGVHAGVSDGVITDGTVFNTVGVPIILSMAHSGVVDPLRIRALLMTASPS